MPWGAVVGAIIASQQSRSNQEKATGANIHAMKNRHQWEVEDLKAAGLNPILSAGGSGTGGLPAAMGAPVVDYGSTITNALQTQSNIQKQSKEIDKIIAETGLIGEQAKVAKKQIQKVYQETQLLMERTLGKNYENIRDSEKVAFFQEHRILGKIKEVSDNTGISPGKILDLFGVNLASFIFGKKGKGR